jgi:hypothetical protein
MSFDFPYELVHVFSYRATLTEPEVIGPVAEGLRLNVYVTGGEAFGPKLKGKIRPVGADWLTIRTDGVGILDVRATVELEDGALVYSYYRGVADLGPEGYQKFLDGEPPPPEGVDLRIQPNYQTSDSRYLWLNRAFFVGAGRAFLERGEVQYDIYQMA